MDLEEDIPANHLLRVFNAAVNQLDDAIFDAAYPGGGRDSYHPKMLTKIMIYAYTQRIYSSRQIAKAVRENMQLEHYFVDGTKIEANANRYTFVWGKAVVKQKAKLQEKVQTLFAAIEEAEKQEEGMHGGPDFPELGESAAITSEKLEHAVKQLEDRLKEKPKDKPLKKAVRIVRKDLLPRLQKYETQEAILGTRNSYSKTDHDVTFMRMKEDHMRNGQL